MRYAIVDPNNIVDNCIEFDGGNWSPPKGYLMIKSDTANMFDIYNPKDGSFSAPPQLKEASDVSNI